MANLKITSPKEFEMFYYRNCKSRNSKNVLGLANIQCFPACAGEHLHKSGSCCVQPVFAEMEVGDMEKDNIKAFLRFGTIEILKKPTSSKGDEEEIIGYESNKQILEEEEEEEDDDDKPISTKKRKIDDDDDDTTTIFGYAKRICDVNLDHLKVGDVVDDEQLNSEMNSKTNRFGSLYNGEIQKRNNHEIEIEFKPDSKSTWNCSYRGNKHTPAFHFVEILVFYLNKENSCWTLMGMKKSHEFLFLGHRKQSCWSNRLPWSMNMNLKDPLRRRQILYLAREWKELPPSISKMKNSPIRKKPRSNHSSDDLSSLNLDDEMWENFENSWAEIADFGIDQLFF